MSGRDDGEAAPVITVTGGDERTPLSTTTNLPAATWPPTTVGDLMTRKVITLGEDEPLGDLETWMQRFRFHHLPVVNADMVLVGLITQTDYLHARLGSAPEGGSIGTVFQGTTASAIMRKGVVYGRMEDSLAMACGVMLREQLGCLPIVLDDKTLVGIVTTTDFVRLAGELLKGA